MCGVIGLQNYKKEKNITDLYKLVIESKIRGLHAFGCAFWDKQKKAIICKKTNIFPTIKFFEDYIKSDSHTLIYHNRYSTSGDWKNQENNQPITTENISIAMNGVISMEEKSVFENKYNIKCKSYNDTEIINQLYLKNKNFNFLKELTGSFAFVALIHDKLYAYRNKFRPLHKFEFKNSVWICSTADIAQRALNIKTEELKPNKIYEF